MLEKELIKMALKRIKKKGDKLYEELNGKELKEKQHGRIYISKLLDVFDIACEDGMYEYFIHFEDGSWGWIDFLIPGFLSIEVKSPGYYYPAAHRQAMRYWNALDEDIKPKIVIISDLNRIWFYNPITNKWSNRLFLNELYQSTYFMIPIIEYSWRMKREKFLQKMQKKDSGGNQNHSRR